MDSRKHHPVWTVYDKIRTARLNVKYYSRRLQVLERFSLILDLILAVAAPTSAVAGLWFWESELGRVTWQFLGIPAAMAAVLKPVLGLTKRIKDYENVLAGYRTLEFDLCHIKSLVEQKLAYTESMRARLEDALERERALVTKNPETRENSTIKRICEEEVLKELPPSCFLIPED